MKNEKDRFNKKFNQTWDRQTDRHSWQDRCRTGKM